MTKNIGEGAARRLLGSSVLADIRPETLGALKAMCRIRRYSAGQTVVHEGENTDFIGCVLSGILRMQKSLADGRQHIVGLLVEGDIFGRVFDGPAEFSIEAATDVEFCSFPRSEFESLLDRAPDLERAVLLNITNELDRAREWMIVLSNQKIAGRLAGFLLMMCSRFGRIENIMNPRTEGIEVRIPISRADLAHLLGTRPESISRSLHSLRDQGDIDVLEPDRILIRDVAALARAADEDELQTIVTLKDLLNAQRLER